MHPPAPCGAGRLRQGPGQKDQKISIHPPRAGRDWDERRYSAQKAQFQSTRPVRGGTGIGHVLLHGRQRFQSTRPVRGGTFHRDIARGKSSISIHPPRAGRDEATSPTQPITLVFQSTRPVRGGTSGAGSAHTMYPDFNPPAPCGAGRLPGCIYLDKGGISIHPPRAGRDAHSIYWCSTSAHFNPPAPCGAGPKPQAGRKATCIFQSTRPVRGGTTYAVKKEI